MLSFTAVPMSEAKTLEVVQDYYGKVLSTSKDLKTSACTACGKPPQYVLDAIKKVPIAVRYTSRLNKLTYAPCPVRSLAMGLSEQDL